MTDLLTRMLYQDKTDLQRDYNKATAPFTLELMGHARFIHSHIDGFNLAFKREPNNLKNKTNKPGL